MWSSVCLSAHIHWPIITGLPVLEEEVRREGKRAREEGTRGGGVGGREMEGVGEERGRGEKEKGRGIEGGGGNEGEGGS